MVILFHSTAKYYLSHLERAINIQGGTLISVYVAKFKITPVSSSVQWTLSSPLSSLCCKRRGSSINDRRCGGRFASSGCQVWHALPRELSLPLSPVRVSIPTCFRHNYDLEGCKNSRISWRFGEVAYCFDGVLKLLTIFCKAINFSG